jgi:hypothetical protein
VWSGGVWLKNMCETTKGTEAVGQRNEGTSDEKDYASVVGPRKRYEKESTSHQRAKEQATPRTMNPR